jgi:acetyl-CoA carboxylase biotin carboxyl carrier protein
MEERYPEEAQTLKDLLALMHEHDLDRIKVKLGDAFYEVVRREGTAVAYAPPPAVAAPPGRAAGPAEAALAAAPAANPNVKKVVAPLTGVFYRSPSPDTEAYVEVGDRVDAGDVLCILEAMKLFNEIQSDYSGAVVRIVPENGELVSQGDDLFWIEP